jgi:hypothetical protein
VTVGEVEKIAKDIGEFFFEIEGGLLRGFAVEAGFFSDGLGQFTDFFDEEDEFLGRTVLGPAAVLAHLREVVL